jgi:cell division protein FtsN
MTRDYKNARRHAERPLPGWVWMLAGLTMGLAVALVVYLNQPRPSSIAPQATTPAPANSPPVAAATQQPKPAPAERRFDFYTLLPELEVVVPESQSRPPAAGGTPTQTTPAQAAASGPYILQAGSFQRASEADTLKANLALLGVEANIQTVTVDQNTWHRVRIGPYNDLAELNRVRERLARNHIDTVTLKER